jgi:hypothetical protein
VKLVRLLFASVPMLAAALAGSGTRAEDRWMSEEAMRADFVGKPLRGYYHNHAPWEAVFHAGGRYEYRGLRGQALGGWYFRGRVFCHQIGPPYMDLSCGAATKISANCYEFHVVDLGPKGTLDEGDFRPRPFWHSRGWREDEPSTCEARPSV